MWKFRREILIFDADSNGKVHGLKPGSNQRIFLLAMVIKMFFLILFSHPVLRLMIFLSRRWTWSSSGWASLSPLRGSKVCQRQAQAGLGGHARQLRQYEWLLVILSQCQWISMYKMKCLPIYKENLKSCWIKYLNPPPPTHIFLLLSCV